MGLGVNAENHIYLECNHGRHLIANASGTKSFETGKAEPFNNYYFTMKQNHEYHVSAEKYGTNKESISYYSNF